MFLYSFICAPTTAFSWLSTFCTLQISSAFYLSLELSWCRVSFLKGDLQFSKFLKNTICIGLSKLKCTEKRFIHFTPLHFLPEFFPHTECKGRPEDANWNVLNDTSFRNYAPFSLQVPSILSILLGILCRPPKRTLWRVCVHVHLRDMNPRYGAHGHLIFNFLGAVSRVFFPYMLQELSIFQPSWGRIEFSSLYVANLQEPSILNVLTYEKKDQCSGIHSQSRQEG